MNDREKSVLLAKAMGWELLPSPSKEGHKWYQGDIGLPVYPRVHLEFYHPDNMALAWRVLNWATEHEQNLRMIREGKSIPLARLVYNDGVMLLPPADAQRRWLDKIVELIIEKDGSTRT